MRAHDANDHNEAPHQDNDEDDKSTYLPSDKDTNDDDHDSNDNYDQDDDHNSNDDTIDNDDDDQD